MRYCRCGLVGLVTRLGGLGGQLASSELSAGEQQLLCLARAVLSPAKLVLIDEATANVDQETDRRLQEVIQHCLADRTVLTIAHRVETVLGCDRVLVMEAGAVVEAGNPNTLLKDNQSRLNRLLSNNL